jgi:hypothetical protein
VELNGQLHVSGCFIPGERTHGVDVNKTFPASDGSRNHIVLPVTVQATDKGKLKVHTIFIFARFLVLGVFKTNAENIWIKKRHFKCC